MVNYVCFSSLIQTHRPKLELIHNSYHVRPGQTKDVDWHKLQQTRLAWMNSGVEGHVLDHVCACEAHTCRKLNVTWKTDRQGLGKAAGRGQSSYLRPAFLSLWGSPAERKTEKGSNGRRKKIHKYKRRRVKLKNIYKASVPGLRTRPIFRVGSFTTVYLIGGSNTMTVQRTALWELC